MDIEITTHGCTFGIELDGDAIDIEQDGVLVGQGRWSGTRIEDCDAVLGDVNDPDQSDDIYDVLDAAIAKAL